MMRHPSMMLVLSAGFLLAPLRGEEAIVSDAKLVGAQNRFAFRLFDAVARGSVGKNVFISPPSVSMALAMTANGAAGETRKGMMSALALDGFSMDGINQGYRHLRKSLQSDDPQVQLTVANSLWAREGVSFLPPFMARNKESFGAEVTSLPFDASAVKAINGWADRNTHGKIREILNSIPDDAMLYLVNAVYFKGEWSIRFDPLKTREEKFTLADGVSRKTPMMSQSGEYRYLRGDGFQAVALPYGKGRTSLYLFLPDEVSGLKQFESRLATDTWEKWLAKFRKMEGSVSLPRFKSECAVELRDTLKGLGMEAAFSPGGFTGMASPPFGEKLCISNVLNRTFVELNEKGTEAAAVTRVEGVFKLDPSPHRPFFSLVADHPFFCAIRDDQTGAILFMGSIVDPRPAF